MQASWRVEQYLIYFSLCGVPGDLDLGGHHRNTTGDLGSLAVGPQNLSAIFLSSANTLCSPSLVMAAEMHLHGFLVPIARQIEYQSTLSDTNKSIYKYCRNSDP